MRNGVALRGCLPTTLIASLLLGVVLPLSAAAHPISLTRATGFVERGKMTVSIEVLAEDLFLFQKVEPTADNRLATPDVQQAAQRHRDFLSSGLIVRDVDGQRMAGRVVDVAVGDLPPGGIDMQKLMDYTIVYVLQYDFAQPPQLLTISQEFGGGKSRIPAFVTLSVKQEGWAPQAEVELPYGEAQPFQFDWQRPPLPADASQQQRDAWFAQRQQEQLGIMDFQTTYAFLYIDDYEVRLEVLMPLKTLEQWFSLERRDAAFLEVGEQDAAREPIERFFAAGNPVEIDGIRVSPVLSRLDFFGLDRRDFAKPSARERISAVGARLGIILSYSTKGPPQQVKVTWDQYNFQLWAVPAVIYAYDTTRRFEFVQFGEPFQWTSPGHEPLPTLRGVATGTLPATPSLSLPVGPALCLVALGAILVWLRSRCGTWLSYAAAVCILGGAALVTAPLTVARVPHPWARPPRIGEDAARDIFATLHRNVYRAFDYRRESDIYDALAESVEGDLLAQLYVQIRQGLEMQEQGGAVARVRDVELIEGHVPPDNTPEWNRRGGFPYHCIWQVEGTVEHWGHIHTRRNEYTALFTVEPRRGQWKITGLQVLGGKRVKYQTGLRLTPTEAP